MMSQHFMVGKTESVLLLPKQSQSIVCEPEFFSGTPLPSRVSFRGIRAFELYETVEIESLLVDGEEQLAPGMTVPFGAFYVHADDIADFIKRGGRKAAVRLVNQGSAEVEVAVHFMWSCER